MLHTYPDAAEIVTAVREFLEHEVMPGTSGSLSFRARVAANLLGVLERELEHGPESEDRFVDLLRELGVNDEAELAERIRVGEVDTADKGLIAALRTMTRLRLMVSNPKYLSDEIDDDPRRA